MGAPTRIHVVHTSGWTAGGSLHVQPSDARPGEYVDAQAYNELVEKVKAAKVACREGHPLAADQILATALYDTSPASSADTVSGTAVGGPTGQGEDYDEAAAMAAALVASARVRDGFWIKGAPTHVLAEFLNELAADGWQLTKTSSEPPVALTDGTGAFTAGEDSDVDRPPAEGTAAATPSARAGDGGHPPKDAPSAGGEHDRFWWEP